MARTLDQILRQRGVLVCHQPEAHERSDHHTIGELALPVTEAMAYILGVLPAFGYLHGQGRAYCDFKPDNVMHVGDGMKLIDLGAVRSIRELKRPVLATPGYMAEEFPGLVRELLGPEDARRDLESATRAMVAADLYAVGRTLLVLMLHWPDWDVGPARYALPDRAVTGVAADGTVRRVLVDHDGLWRFVRRACAPDPQARFADADEMAEALYKVLCQVAAREDGHPRPRIHDEGAATYVRRRWTNPEPRIDPRDWRTLPRPQLPDHPRCANHVAGSTIQGTDPPSSDLEQLIANATGRLASDRELSWADTAALVFTYCQRAHRATSEADRQADVQAAGHALEGTVPEDGRSWRERRHLETVRHYLQGVVALADRVPGDAVDAFGRAYGCAPGELACALGYALALEAAEGLPPEMLTAGHCEIAAGGATAERDGHRRDQPAHPGTGRLAQAASLYQQVAMTDRSWVAAIGGLARTLLGLGRTRDAARVLLAVPTDHPARTDALTLACRIMEQHGPLADDVVAAANERIERSSATSSTAADHKLVAALYGAALAALQRGEAVTGPIAGHPPAERGLRRCAERALNRQADLTPDPAECRRLRELADRIRPWSLA